eukprot:531714_1
MISFVTITILSICAAEYQSGDVDTSALATNGVAFLGHWMFGFNPGNGTYTNYNRHSNQFQAGEIEITLTVSNASQFMFHNMRIDTYSTYDFNSWQELEKVKYGESHSWFCFDPWVFKRVDNVDTWIFTKFVDQHIVSRQWWVFLVDCDYTEINESIDTNIQYKLHFTQDSDSYFDINNMHAQM